jgi:hypothetical protein
MEKRREEKREREKGCDEQVARLYTTAGFLLNLTSAA